MCRDKLHCGKEAEHDAENEDAGVAMSRNSENDTRVNGDDGKYMAVGKEEGKISQCIKQIVKKTHKDEVITIYSGDEMA